ncbi:hypothetical protein [Glycomyces sambucus]|uniref:hypothetical protein n=1 Tax=Glycomyces sambucus TaxID=380244 RepID=UPI000B84347F|nr:hypothetical protein [Glycomyces sambucus]
MSTPWGYLASVAVLPFLVVHGDHDTLVHRDDARRFAERPGVVSESTAAYAEPPGAHHGFDLFDSPRFTAVVNAVEVFAAEATAVRNRSC